MPVELRIFKASAVSGVWGAGCLTLLLSDGEEGIPVGVGQPAEGDKRTGHVPTVSTNRLKRRANTGEQSILNPATGESALGRDDSPRIELPAAKGELADPFTAAHLRAVHHIPCLHV